MKPAGRLGFALSGLVRPVSLSLSSPLYSESRRYRIRSAGNTTIMDDRQRRGIFPSNRERELDGFRNLEICMAATSLLRTGGLLPDNNGPPGIWTKSGVAPLLPASCLSAAARSAEHLAA